MPTALEPGGPDVGIEHIGVQHTGSASEKDREGHLGKISETANRVSEHESGKTPALMAQKQKTAIA